MKFNMRTSFSRKNRNLALVTVIGMVATTTLMATAPQHDASVLEEKAWPVTTRLVEAADISPELRLFGRVETPRHAQLTAAVTATVNAIGVQEGELVEAGQILVVLDDADEMLRARQREADVSEARAALESIRQQLLVDEAVLQHMRELHQLTVAKRDRLRKLQKQNLVAREQMEDTAAAVARQAIELARQQLTVDNHPQRLAVAQATLERSQALLAEQELRLARTVVTAPFRGKVSAVQVSPGDRVSEGKPLVSIYDTAALQVRVTIPNSAIAPIKQAMASGAVVAGLYGAEQSQSLRLGQLAAAVDSGRAGVDALFEIVANGERLELGRALDVTVVLPQLQQVTAIPVQSLYGNNQVYTVVDGRLRGVEVQTLGQRRGTDGELQLLVRAGNGALNSEMLTTTLPQASTGLRVKVING